MRQPCTPNICSPWANKDFFIINKLLTYYNIYYQKYILYIFVNTNFA